MLLEGKKVVATSAGSIGTVIARELLRHGAEVAVWDIDEDALVRMRDAATVDGRRAAIRVMDVTSEKSVADAAAAAIAALGHVDALVCTAAILDFAPVATMTLDQWRRTIDVNLTGVFLCNRAFVSHMMDRRQGSIINISSAGGLRGQPDLAHYCASKFGVNGLSESLAREVGPANVRVNAICPGWVDARMGDAVLEWYSNRWDMGEEELRQRVVADTALRRFALPTDVANAVIFLASDLSTFVTGEALPVTGGLTY